MKISIIGSGNVATHIAKVLHLKKGFFIHEIFSKNIQNAQNLAKELNGLKKCNRPITTTNILDFETNHFGNRHTKSKLFILAVKDEFIPQVAEEIILPKDAIFVHTSGSTPLETLEKIKAKNPEKNIKIGVLYPLQTFSKNIKEILPRKIVDFWQNIPICLQAEDLDTMEFLYEFAKNITSKIYQINSQQRQMLHLGATFACNFSNYMYHIANEILQKSGLPFDMLENLVKETAQKAFIMPPFEAQTGVAKRGDLNVIQIHQQKLADNPLFQELYTHITKDVLALYHKNIFFNNEKK